MKKSIPGNARRTPAGQAVVYGLGDMGTNFVYMLISSYTTLYFTDSVGLSAAFVGTMMLICRFLDGGSDVLMGALIEKTHSRWGKCRPWFVVSIIPFFIGVLLLYRVPEGFSLAGKQVYSYLAYIFMTVICYTASNLSFTAMLSRFTFDDEDRIRVNNIRMIISMLASLVAGALTLQFIDMAGGVGNPLAWKRISLIYGIVCLVLHTLCGLMLKERPESEMNEESNAHTSDSPFRESLKSVITCKYFYLALALFTLFYVTVGLGNIDAYYVREVLGSNSYMTPLAATTAIVFVLFPLMSRLTKKFGKRNLCIAGSLLMTVSGIILLLKPSSLPLAIVSYLINALGRGVFMALILTYCSDLVDYIALKAHIRTEGFSYASYTVGSKVGTGLGGAIVGWGLALGGYDGLLASQSAATVKSILMLNAMSKIVIGIVLAIIIYFLRLDRAIEKEKEKQDL